MFGLSPLMQADTQKQYTSRAWYADPITIGRSSYYAMASERRNWHVEESGGQIHVHRFYRGRSSLETNGLPLECDTGAITLLDYGHPFKAVHTNNECHSFFVPYDVIGYRPSDAPHAIVYPPQSKMGELIGREMDNLLSQLEHGAVFLDQRDIDRFLGCVEVAMCPKSASPSAAAHLRESLKRSIQLFIEQRLHTFDLNTSLILRNFGVSRASLYRMFEPESGVRAYINHRRLMRAVVDLSVEPTRRGHIREVSERWGFASDASFSRMVKNVFGVAPGSLFKMPLQFTSDGKTRSALQSLMLKRAKSLQMITV